MQLDAARQWTADGSGMPTIASTERDAGGEVNPGMKSARRRRWGGCEAGARGASLGFGDADLDFGGAGVAARLASMWGWRLARTYLLQLELLSPLQHLRRLRLSPHRRPHPHLPPRPHLRPRRHRPLHHHRHPPPLHLHRHRPHRHPRPHLHPHRTGRPQTCTVSYTIAPSK